MNDRHGSIYAVCYCRGSHIAAASARGVCDAVVMCAVCCLLSAVDYLLLPLAGGVCDAVVVEQQRLDGVGAVHEEPEVLDAWEERPVLHREGKRGEEGREKRQERREGIKEEKRRERGLKGEKRKEGEEKRREGIKEKKK
jgi:hypothetical protein